MAVVLGKRKTRPSEEESAEALAKAQAIFQRHFESTFAPLHVAPVQSASRPGGDEDEDAEDLRSDTEGSESEWDGLSADDDGTHCPASGNLDWAVKHNALRITIR